MHLRIAHRLSFIGLIVLAAFFGLGGCAQSDAQAHIPQGFFQAKAQDSGFEYPLVTIIHEGDEASVYHWARSHGGLFGLGQIHNPYAGGSLFGATGAQVVGEIVPESQDAIRMKLRKTRKGAVDHEYVLERITEEEFKQALSLEHSGRTGFYDHEEESCQAVFGKSCTEVF